jgi:hypothetical protein
MRDVSTAFSMEGSPFMYRMLQFIFRILLYQKHPGKQIIASLICIPIGGIICYFATQGIVIGDYVYRWPYLMIVGFTAALLGAITLIQGIINALLRGWDGRTMRRQPPPKPREPKPLKYVPPKKHQSAAQSKSIRAAQHKKRARIAQSKKSNTLQAK